MFDDALQKLTTEGTTRANALLGLAVVEWSDSRYAEALRILTANAPLFNRISNQAIKGAYHSQVAMVLRKLVTAENRSNYIQRAINEYQEADKYFKLARNVVFRADVKNNVGNLLRQLSRFTEAHSYLAEARRLTVSVKDRIRTAQVDDTCALLLIDEGRLPEAETTARRAVSILEKTDHHCLLADALITHGIALARLPNQTEQADFTLQRAIEVAHQVGAYSKAGLAALTLIEELESELALEVMAATYDRASRWLSELQSQEVQLRLNAAARKVLARKEFPKADDAMRPLFKPCNLQVEVSRFESTLIRRALVAVNGRVTRAAALLSTSHQALASIINHRHPELLKVRSPVRPRPRRE